MDRPPSCCDFCGTSRVFQEYGTDLADLNWYACAECAGIIDSEAWEELVERSVAAHDCLRPARDGEEPIFRTQAENLVQAFRALRLIAA
jgi:hypothetical protein